MIRIHLLDGSHEDTPQYSQADAERTIADGGDLELTGLRYSDEPGGSLLIGADRVTRIEELP